MRQIYWLALRAALIGIYLIPGTVANSDLRAENGKKLQSDTVTRSRLPVINASTNTARIRDNDYLVTDAWGLDPSLRPDTYHVQFPVKNNTVTFITDLDSISFDTEFGKHYDFVIVLNGKDSCFTRISAQYQGVTHSRSLKAISPGRADTVPFYMQDSRLYMKGTLNNKIAVRVQLDLGAGTSCINKNSAAVKSVNFDTKQLVTNTNGTKEEPAASAVNLVLAGLSWTNMPLVQVSNMQDHEDMIIGNSLFRDKVIEINYDKKILIIRDSMYYPGDSYSRHRIIIYQHRPLFEMELKVGDRYYPFYFLFDTGRDGTMLIGEDFTARYNLWDRYDNAFSIGDKKMVIIPEARIGAKTFRDILTNANDPKYPTGKQSLVGNEILNQFNMVLDNHNGFLYLLPNKLGNDNYSTWRQFKLKAAALVALSVLVIALLVWIIRKRIASRGSSVFVCF